MYPNKIGHWIDGKERDFSNEYFLKVNPANGEKIAEVTAGAEKEIDEVVGIAQSVLESWRSVTVVSRSEIIRRATLLIIEKKSELIDIVALETGKSKKDAAGEVSAAIEMGFFVAGEGRRFYGKTTTSAVPGRFAMTIRQPVGICGLITPANTPIANVAWKVFPALLCGNVVILKPPEDAPYTALWFAKIMHEAGLPAGVLSVVQGLGKEAGEAIVKNTKINLISFTGSVDVGKHIQSIAGGRLAKVCLELGGKNPLVVCDDADLDIAVHDVVLSAFSNAGQRCASGSRIIVFDKVYDSFKNKLLEFVSKMKVGSEDDDDFGPVINERQFSSILSAVSHAVENTEAKLLCGGKRANNTTHQNNGYFISPTVLEIENTNVDIWTKEIFGPVTTLFHVKDFGEALRVANDSSYALTASIHSKNIHRTQEFIDKCIAGVVYVNGPTFGSEPHLPFGGLKDSGNGGREAGAEALDVYSEIKTVYIKHYQQFL